MPFQRPTLTDLINQAAQDIAAELPGSDPLLRFSNLGIMGKVQANLAHLIYGYLDWISQQATPFTATEEALEAWAALKSVFRKPATSASGAATFNGLSGSLIPNGSKLVRGDGVTYTSTADATVSTGGTAIVQATADADPTGLTGAFGDAVINTVLTLGQAIAGVQSNGIVTTAFTGGADLETDDSLRSRMLAAFQNPPQGGAQPDYVEWALQVAGVTRAWCVPNGYGAGTVVVYVMLDQVESAYNGFPQGTNGVAANETRAAAATGDQLLVANYLFSRQPVTALVYAVSPINNPIPFTISGLSGAGSTVQNAVAAAIAQVFLTYGTPGGTVDLSDIESAIAAVSGSEGFVITSPAANITQTAGQLPTVGAITWS